MIGKAERTLFQYCVSIRMVSAKIETNYKLAVKSLISEWHAAKIQ